MWRDFYSGCGQADEAATKLIYLVLRDLTKKWTSPPITRKLAATQFVIRFGQIKDSLPWISERKVGNVSGVSEIGFFIKIIRLERHASSSGSDLNRPSWCR